MEPPKPNTPNFPNQFICVDCGKSYGTVQALTAHRRVHKENQRPVAGQSIQDVVKDIQDLAKGGSAIEHILDPAPPHPPSHPHSTPCPVVVKVKKLPHGSDLPNLQKATPGSAAVDLYAAIPEPICIGVGERANPPIPTAVSVEIPAGYFGLIAPRSGLGNNYGVTFINAPGVIDSDYRGEIKVGLVNHSRSKYWVRPGDRISQMIILKSEDVEYQYVAELSGTERGEGGFGSTGVSMQVAPAQTINFIESAAEVRKVPQTGPQVRKLPPTHDLEKNEV